MNSLQTTCDTSTTQFFDATKNLRVDQSKLISVPSIDVIIENGWYKVTLGPIYVAVYVDKTSDLDYNYIITTVKIGEAIISCNDITIDKRYKNGVPAPDNVVPSNVMSTAISTFPAATTACGTGIWNGCTAGIQNKYLITGTIAAVGLYFLTKK